MMISVVLAVYNEEKFIREAVNSISVQEGVEIEIIVVDDGSTDRTSEILHEMQKHDTKLKIYENPAKGKVSAFNFGVKHSSGEWIVLFAGDDIMPQNSLKKRLDFLMAEDYLTPTVGLSRLKILSDHKTINGKEVPKNASLGAYSGSCYMMNKPAIEMLWPVPEILPNEDTWLELCVRHLPLKIVHSPVVGCVWRMHQNNSISIDLNWKEFNRRYTLRMEALSLFYNKHKYRMKNSNGKKFIECIRCEQARRDGKFFDIIMMKLPLSDRLRSVAYSGPIFYHLRRAGMSFFTGIS